MPTFSLFEVPKKTNRVLSFFLKKLTVQSCHYIISSNWYESFPVNSFYQKYPGITVLSYYLDSSVGQEAYTQDIVTD
jgi:hypothetical protein